MTAEVKSDAMKSADFMVIGGICLNLFEMGIRRCKVFEDRLAMFNGMYVFKEGGRNMFGMRVDVQVCLYCCGGVSVLVGRGTSWYKRNVCRNLKEGKVRAVP